MDPRAANYIIDRTESGSDYVKKSGDAGDAYIVTSEPAAGYRLGDPTNHNPTISIISITTSITIVESRAMYSVVCSLLLPSALLSCFPSYATIINQ